jgi:hypothetical protein
LLLLSALKTPSWSRTPPPFLRRQTQKSSGGAAARLSPAPRLPPYLPTWLPAGGFATWHNDRIEFGDAETGLLRDGVRNRDPARHCKITQKDLESQGLEGESSSWLSPHLWIGRTGTTLCGHWPRSIWNQSLRVTRPNVRRCAGDWHGSRPYGCIGAIRGLAQHTPSAP